MEYPHYAISSVINVYNVQIFFKNHVEHHVREKSWCMCLERFRAVHCDFPQGVKGWR